MTTTGTTLLGPDGWASDDVWQMDNDALTDELHKHLDTWVLEHTGWDKPQSPYLNLDVLLDSPRNWDSAKKYFPFLHDNGWEPMGGYPGSDTRWLVMCLRCGWVGLVFNSHMRRGARHRGCKDVDYFTQRSFAAEVTLAVAVNRCAKESGLGRQLGYALSELRKAHHIGGSTSELALTLKRSALLYVRQARRYVEDGVEAAPPKVTFCPHCRRDYVPGKAAQHVPCETCVSEGSWHGVCQCPELKSQP